MKIFDCTTFYSEHLMMDVRFNVLNEYVHKFIVSESTFSHSGKPKKLNFDINNYPKFKDKIIYVIIDKEPNDIIRIEDKLLTTVDKRSNSLKRIGLSYDYMAKSLDIALDNDLIILSDNDEIPNLDSKKFKSSNKDIFIFKQLFFYYKFNLLYDLVPWYGSKAAKKKKLLSMSWLRNLKNKQYQFWRLDTLFSNNKYINLDIINDGGWHFTNLKTPEELYQKLTNFGHHDEFELSGLTVNDLKKKIEEKKVFFNHFLDKENYKERWNYDYELKKIENELLPQYLKNNLKKFKEWFD
jgi:beta-1,4-mannosyl-glycoprotein beta-1,4-N-acetylglucosaminyltransferase